jgi:hypothetical protein
MVVTALGTSVLASSLFAPPCMARAEDAATRQRAFSLAQSAPPMPPTRPTTLPPLPLAANPPPPQQEPPAKEMPARVPPAADASTEPSPYRLHSLPTASRARMHECGEEWQHMKATGAATDKTWYTFAQTCLAR